MNPWWKRPSSESSPSSSATEEKNDDKKKSGGDRDDDSQGPRRRRRGARRGQGGGRGKGGDGGGKGGDGRGRGGGQRKKGSGSGRPSNPVSAGKKKAAGPAVVLVEVEALHKHLKHEGDGPGDTPKLFENLGSGADRRAIACGMRKQKVQRALKELDFDIERIDGGVEDARLRIALDALELALENPGIQIHMITHDSAVDVLGERLRHHGASLTLFSLAEPPVLGDDLETVRADEDDDEGDEDTEEEDTEDQESDDDEDGDEDEPRDRDDDDDERDGRRRRRRRGRRGSTGDGDEDEDRRGRKPRRHGREDRRHDRPKDAASSAADPLELLTAAIARLVQGESEVLWATKVRQEMSSIDPRFNELDHGYENLEGLLREAERRGRIVLQKDPRTATFVITGWRAA